MRFARLSLPFVAAVAMTSTLARAQTNTTDPAKIAEAKQHMQAGRAFYEDPSGHKCEEAYREFKKAYDLTGSLNAVKGMAVCSLELEHDGEAIEEYQKYLSGKGSQIPAGEREQVESDLKQLRAGVTWVTLKTDHPGTRIVDVRTPSAGYPITNKYVIPEGGIKLGLHPGAHVFTASLDGFRDVTWKIDMSNNGTYDHTFELDKEPPPETNKPPPQVIMTRPVPKAVYVTGALTLALVAPTVIFGVRALGKESDYKAANGTIPKAQADEMQADVKSADLITDVFLGVTVAAALTTGVLYIARPSKPMAPKTGSARINVAPFAGSKSGGAVLLGTF